MLFFLALMFISYVAVFRAEKNRKERGLFATLIEMKLLVSFCKEKCTEGVNVKINDEAFSIGSVADMKEVVQHKMMLRLNNLKSE